jgi:hypothetical protein
MPFLQQLDGTRWMGVCAFCGAHLEPQNAQRPADVIAAGYKLGWNSFTTESGEKDIECPSCEKLRLAALFRSFMRPR